MVLPSMRYLLEDFELTTKSLYVLQGLFMFTVLAFIKVRSSQEQKENGK